MEFHHLKSILNDLIIRVNHRNYPHEFELKRELYHLNENERKLLKKRFLQQKFSYGVLRVIKILKDVNIINMCDYLQENLKDAAEIINVLIDQPIENLNLFEEVLSSDMFCSQVFGCIKQYFQELIDHPEWDRIEMISSIYHLTSRDLYQRTILKPCIEFLLKYDVDNKCELTEAISNQKQWNEKTDYKGSKFLEIFRIILPLHADFVVTELIGAIENEDRINWFFVLMIVKLTKDRIDYKSKLLSLILICKKLIFISAELIKSIFINYRNGNCSKSLCKSLLLARQIHHYSVETTKYESWVRDNISEIKYLVKDTAEITFSDLIESLQRIIEYETDYDIISIHLFCSISAPSFQYHHVREYKQLLKSKLEV